MVVNVNFGKLLETILGKYDITLVVLTKKRLCIFMILKVTGGEVPVYLVCWLNPKEHTMTLEDKDIHKLPFCFFIEKKNTSAYEEALNSYREQVETDFDLALLTVRDLVIKTKDSCVSYTLETLQKIDETEMFFKPMLVVGIERIVKDPNVREEVLKVRFNMEAEETEDHKRELISLSRKYYQAYKEYKNDLNLMNRKYKALGKVLLDLEDISQLSGDKLLPDEILTGELKKILSKTELKLDNMTHTEEVLLKIIKLLMRHIETEKKEAESELDRLGTLRLDLEKTLYTD